MFLFCFFPLKQSEDFEVIFQVLQWATCDVGDEGDIFSQVNQGNRPRVSQLRH